VSDGWNESATAWIAALGGEGDWGRRYVLDAPMAARVEGRGFRTALDVGCGEGRFCRALKAWGVAAVGIDPTESLIREARERDPTGDYRIGRGEALDFADASFDLVVSYLTLINIPDVRRGIAEMTRVLRPGGTLLIANMTSFVTACPPEEGSVEEDGRPSRFYVDHYLEERAHWAGWNGMRIRDWHRPLSLYMSLLLDQGLLLRHFAEPTAVGGDPARAERLRRVPFYLIMEWEKPAAASRLG
jgi:SAM-dependent methyltransferase